MIREAFRNPQCERSQRDADLRSYKLFAARVNDRTGNACGEDLANSCGINIHDRPIAEPRGMLFFALHLYRAES